MTSCHSRMHIPLPDEGWGEVQKARERLKIIPGTGFSALSSDAQGLCLSFLSIVKPVMAFVLAVCADRPRKKVLSS